MDVYNSEGELVEEPERIGEERDSAQPEEVEDGNVEDEEDVESPRDSSPPKEKYAKKKRKRCSSEESSVAEASPDSDKKKVKGPLSNTNKSINVGNEFQAEIGENNDLTNYKDYMPDREDAYWAHNGHDVDNDELEKFVNDHSSKYLVPIDKVLFILMEKKMNYREAAIEIAKRNVLQDKWKDDERFIFENSFVHIGKNFHQMHAAIAHRSLRSIIHYYYESKKSITYRQFASKTTTEIDEDEEYEESLDPYPELIFDKMCENCGEKAEGMMSNSQMNRTECMACLIYFKLMGVPRPTSLRLVLAERFQTQISCPDSMRDMMRQYTRLSAPATGETFETRRSNKELFSMDVIVRGKKQIQRWIQPKMTNSTSLPISKQLKTVIRKSIEPSNGASELNGAISMLNGVVEKLARDIKAIPPVLEVMEDKDPKEQKAEDPEVKVEESEPKESESKEPDFKKAKSEEPKEEPTPESTEQDAESIQNSELHEKTPEPSDASSEASSASLQTPARSDRSETPKPESNEKSPKKGFKKSKISSAVSKSTRKSKKPTESHLNIQSGSNGRLPGGPSMYIWHNKKKTLCQEEMEILLDDSRRKLFEAGQHSSRIDFKQVANWKNDMKSLRERMENTNVDLDLCPEFVFNDERTRHTQRWSDEDQVNVQRCFKWYGPNFRQIADVMGNKTADQVHTFYMNNYQVLEESHTEFNIRIKKEVAAADEKKAKLVAV